MSYDSRSRRTSAITQRLTKPRPPTTTGKIERLRQTLQLELLNARGPFAGIEDAQSAVDSWRKDYNAERPHQSLGMAFPSARFAPGAGDALGLRIPAELTRPSLPPPSPLPVPPQMIRPLSCPAGWLTVPAR